METNDTKNSTKRPPQLRLSLSAFHTREGYRRTTGHDFMNYPPMTGVLPLLPWDLDFLDMSRRNHYLTSKECSKRSIYILYSI